MDGHNRDVKAQIGSVEAQNGVVEDLCTSVVSYSCHFNEEQDPDPNRREKSDPDPHLTGIRIRTKVMRIRNSF